MTWWTWKFWRLAYAPMQDGEQPGCGYVWVPIGAGLYWAARRER